MQIILTKEEVIKLKAYLTNDLSYMNDLTNVSRKTFAYKTKKYFLRNGMLYLRKNDIEKEIIADDDLQRQEELFKSLHHPFHLGMKKMYKVNPKSYAGFKRKTLYIFISELNVYKWTL